MRIIKVLDVLWVLTEMQHRNKILKLSKLNNAQILWPSDSTQNLSHGNKNINIQRYWLEKSHCIIVFN